MRKVFFLTSFCFAFATCLFCGCSPDAENDNYYLGLIHGAIGDCYNASYNSGEEVANMKKSLDSFKDD